MHLDIWTDRQHMLGKVPYEYYHYLDNEAPVVDFHQHPFYEIFFFLDGDVRYTIEGKTYALQPGDILLTNSLDVHRPVITPGKPYERVVLWLTSDFFQTIPVDEPSLIRCFSDAATKDYRLVRPTESQFVRLRGICDRISKAQNSTRLGHDALVYACVVEFLIRVCQCYYESDFALQDITENQTVNAVITYINEHIAGKLTLDQLSEQFFVSKFYLSRLFREYAGLSIYQYITKRRLSIARELLTQGYSVTDAYLECGYGDYSNFQKAFKRAFGKSPKEFTRQR